MSNYNAAREKAENIIGQKIREARAALKIGQKELSDGLAERGVNITPAAICKWETGCSVPSAYQLIALCDFLGINDTLSYFSSGAAGLPLNEEGLSRIREYTDLLISSGKFTPNTVRIRPSVKTVSLCIFDMPASAGYGSYTDSDEHTFVNFPETSIPAGTDFGVRISGDSMMPNYTNGQIAMVHRTESILPGEVGIFNINGDTFIKCYTETEPSSEEISSYTDSDGFIRPKIILKSLNRAYPDIPVPPEGNLTVIGKVLN